LLTPYAAKLTANIEDTKKCIEICHELGVPCLRANTGRCGAVPNFDELMRLHGVDPVLPGHTKEEGFKWCTDGI
jgi:L-ribulose-5-phosphate 3-epimerase